MTFITLEGGEGSGKTSQAKILQQYLSDCNIKSIITKEPGGTVLADQLRSLLLSKEIKDAATEFALLTAARRDHVMNLIRPKLAEGFVVICDRFLDSSLVYQGFVKGLDMEMMMRVHQYLVGDITPDITFLLDIDPEISTKRLRNNDRVFNHYDASGIEFHKKIREGFLKISERFSSRVVVINAGESSDNVAFQIRFHIDKIVNLNEIDSKNA